MGFLTYSAYVYVVCIRDTPMLVMHKKMTAYQLRPHRWRLVFSDRLAVFYFFYSMPKTLHGLDLRLLADYLLTKYLVGSEYM